MVLFKQLKQTWVDFKNQCLYHRILEKGEGSLSWEDVVTGAKVSWETAFTYRLIRKSWRAVGIVPFTRRVEITLRRKEDKAALKAASQPVKVMTLNKALKVFAQANSNVNLPERRDQGRDRGGRLHFGKPLTSAESLAVGNAEEAEKQTIREQKAAIRNAKAEEFVKRGEDAATELARHGGDPTQVKAMILKDFLRWKGVEKGELTKAKKDDLVQLYQDRFSLAGALNFQALPIPSPPSSPPPARDQGDGGDNDAGDEDTLEPAAPARDQGDGGDDDAGDEDTLEGTFIVQEIRFGPNIHGKYLVKWEGYDSDENTWEPKCNLPEDMVKEYLDWRYEDDSESD